MTIDAPQQTPEPTASGKAKKEIIISPAQAITLRKKLRIGQLLALGSYIGLIIFFSAQNAFGAGGSFKTWLVEMIPLVIFIPGLIKQSHRTYSWICFVSLMYFVAIIPLLMGHWRWTDWLVTLLVCTLFTSAMMTSRWLQYWRYYLSTPAGAAANQQN
jgi:uncharacterized membrane protein